LLSENYPQHDLDQTTIQRLMDEPAYWCFCWASGQVLSKYLFDSPALVKGKTVLDFGAGSGVVAIAVALNDAAKVVACDNDEMALLACGQKTELNKVAIDLLDDLAKNQEIFDIAIVADVLYDRDNLPLLALLKQHAKKILVADSRIKNFNEFGYLKRDVYHSCTIPDLNESAEFNRVTLYFSDGVF
jgi:predicted nicotinamide N-methyase|tara:strand:+ start:866 stop:1426 length:561 start_codon:yes stop_codon:yes gene_type:complete